MPGEMVWKLLIDKDKSIPGLLKTDIADLQDLPPMANPDKQYWHCSCQHKIRHFK